METIKITY